MISTSIVLVTVGLMLGRSALCLPQHTHPDLVDQPTLTAQQSSGQPGLLLSTFTCEFTVRFIQLSSASFDNKSQRNRPLSLQL